MLEGKHQMVPTCTYLCSLKYFYLIVMGGNIFHNEMKMAK